MSLRKINYYLLIYLFIIRENLSPGKMREDIKSLWPACGSNPESIMYEELHYRARSENIHAHKHL